MEAMQKQYAAIEEALCALGFTLDAEQLHIGGERALMSAHKLVLTGRDTKDSSRVVIKASLDALGAKDIADEHDIREVLQRVHFASADLSFPPERYFSTSDDMTLSVTDFIEQERVFVDYPLRDQFFMMLKLFEAQEKYHATTHEHTKSLQGAIPVWTVTEYLTDVKNIGDVVDTLETKKLAGIFIENKELIARFSGFLVHTDLVPHNFRVRNGSLYALDQVAIRFGNKYEGLARLVNYMLIHNPALTEKIIEYVRKYRGEDDAKILHIMRCYKAAVLARYYKTSLETAEGNLKELTQIRLNFWLSVLTHLIDNTEIPPDHVAAYKEKRDALRTDDEKARQREFAQA